MTTNNNHPITPPPELYGKWYDESPDDDELGLVEYVATQAARWGADQELEACCAWVRMHDHTYALNLRTARRPKPPSLKEQAMKQLQAMEQHGALNCNVDTIRRALEQLDD